MQRPNLLGKSKLSQLRIPSDIPDSPELPASVASGDSLASHPLLAPDTAHASGEPGDGLVKLTFLAPDDLAERLYAEVAFDPERRWMKDVLIEILKEGLKHRPDPGKAPASFIANLKSRGKRKKS